VQDLAKQARVAIEQMGGRGRTTRIPEEVREAVMAYVEQARSAKVSWDEIAATVGLSKTVLARWQRATRRPGANGRLVPVTVGHDHVGEANGTLVLATPSGYRLEGLSIGNAVEILRAIR